jgi:hypothetical protein
VIAYRDHLASGVKYRARVIAALFDIGRKSGAAKRCSHLFGNRVKNVLEYLKLNRIARHGESLAASV